MRPCYGVFVTAYNPRGDRVSAEQNVVAQRRLKAWLIKNKYTFFEGEGRGEDPTVWEPEPSVLVLGVTELEARKLGERLSQNAVVMQPLEGPVRLLLLR